MNEIKSCAPTDLWTTWEQIQWNKCEHEVRKLQARIVKAQMSGRHNKVKALQWMLTHSFYGKALAVKRVTSNGGKKTAGVDHVLWNTPNQKMDAIASLKRRGYHPQPLRRVNIKRVTVNCVRLEYQHSKIEQCRHCTTWRSTQWQKPQPIRTPTASEKKGVQRMRKKCASRYLLAKSLHNGYWKEI